ncbi:glycosyltransferase family 2 protein [Zhongshania borealis]|uniref:Glycosyltransferase family 2 protein n=1 Tax=Zhongshania borealis TaxID=889488 RepID=A0ABP7WL78_9GAMM
MSVLGVIVCYHPDGDILKRIDVLSEQCDFLVVYDNSEHVNTSIASHVFNKSNVELISNGENVGIATALNYAVTKAMLDGYKYLLSSDQDTDFEHNYVCRMLSVLEENEGVRLLAPLYFDKNRGKNASFPVRKGCFAIRNDLSRCASLQKVFAAITSGMIYDVSVFEELGGFIDDYFIDYVDNEFCLRAVSNNIDVFVSPDIVVRHALGDRTSIAGISPTNYSPLRKYYMTRNRFDVYKKYFVKFPFFVFYDFLAFGWDLARIVLFESDKSLKLKYVVYALKDFVFNKMGKFSR